MTLTALNNLVNYLIDRGYNELANSIIKSPEELLFYVKHGKRVDQ